MGVILTKIKNHTGGNPKVHANARTFPIFIQILCNTTKNNNQYNNSKQLTTAERSTADFSVFPPVAGFFFAKKNLSGVNSKAGGDL